MSNRPRRTTRSRAPQRPSTAPRDRAVPLRVVGLAIAVAAVVVAVIIVIIAVSGGDDAPETVRVNGASLPSIADEGADAAVGLKAPVFSTTGVDGQMHTVGSGGGPSDPAKVLLFVSEDCAGCGDAVTSVVDWLGASSLPDLVAIEIVVLDPSADADTWLAGLGWTGQRWLDSAHHTLADAFGVDAPPVWIVHDRTNHVLERVVGSADVTDLVAAATASV